MKPIIILMLFSSGILQAQWNQTNGPDGGYIYCIDNYYFSIYAGTWSGVYCSTNNGANWILVGLNQYSIKSLHVKYGKFYAGTTNGYIYISTNYGTTWQRCIINPTINVPINTIRRYPYRTELFAGTAGNGLYRSTNFGSSWYSYNNSGLTNFNINSIIFIPKAGYNYPYTFIGTDNGIFLSTNFGASWEASGLTNQIVKAIDTVGKYIFAGTASGKIFRSTNYGLTWMENLNCPSSVNALEALITNTGDSIIYVGTNGNRIYRSTDFGNTWSNIISSAPLNSYISTFLLTPDNFLYVGTLGGGIYLSQNHGISWAAAKSYLRNSS